MTIEYREETPPGWSTGVEQTWDVAERCGGYVLTGLCPTCGDGCVVTIDEVAVVPGQNPADRKAGATGPERLVLVCNCKTVHPGTPTGRRGCGRGGYLALHLS